MTATDTETSAPAVSTPDQDQLLSPEQVASRLQVKTITVLRLIWDKKLTASKVGSLWRVSPDAIAAYLAGTTNKGRAPQWPHVS